MTLRWRWWTRIRTLATTLWLRTAWRENFARLLFADEKPVRCERGK